MASNLPQQGLVAGVLAQLAEQDEKVYVGPPWVIDGHDLVLNTSLTTSYPTPVAQNQ